MAAGDPNNPTPSLQDIINLSNVSPAPAQSANVPPIPMANPEVPQPPTLTNTPLAPALAGPSSPQSLAGPQALAPSATESQAQSTLRPPSNNLKAPGAAPSSITLPAQTRRQSPTPSGEQSQNQPSMLRKIGMFAADLGLGHHNLHSRDLPLRKKHKVS